MKQSLYFVLLLCFVILAKPLAIQEKQTLNREKIHSRINEVKDLLLRPRATKPKSKKLTIMVSSTVYGIEPILNQVYKILNNLGYEVWMSHKGTLPVYSSQSAFDNCLQAVKKADLFLCIITPQYGSGRSENSLSITHKELLMAIKLKKLRWVLAHDHVVFARSLLANLGYPTQIDRKTLRLRKSPIFGNLKVIDMYEDATLDFVPLANRKGNWVQKYSSLEDITTYVSAQFKNYDRIKDLFVSKVQTK